VELELFQTTVKEYKRFTQQLPLDYSEAVSGNLSDTTYVAAHTRLMLLRKYTRNGRGNLYLTDIVSKAISRFSEHSDYLSAFQARFEQSCNQSLNHVLADGTERTLDESIDDTMYGLHLHADEERIRHIAQDSELLRLYCVVKFVQEIENLVIELSDFFETNGILCAENERGLQAPVIHLESHGSNKKNITGSPFWGNLIGSDMTEEDTIAIATFLVEEYTSEEWQLLLTAYAFTRLLAQEQFCYDEMIRLVFEPTIDDWGDFSEAIAYYKSIPSPGMSSVIRYDKQRDAAYIHVYPHVEEGFFVDSPQIVTDVHVITLVKDIVLSKWRVFAFGGRVAPYIRG
jgi:predicted lactoylglutathione lyase